MNTESATHSSSRPAARKVLVVGATGGSGRAAVAALAGAGHHVTAFSRHADRLAGQIEGITTINGDAMNKADVDHAVAGHDAVIVTLGITENPIRVRILGPKHTPADVRSAGTRNVIDAMKSHGIERLVVQSSYGIGETAQHLRIRDRLFFALLVKQQMADTAVQESVVRSSGLDWTLVQPVHLTEAVDGPDAFTSTDGRARKMTVGRGPVGRVLAAIVGDESLRHKTVSVSG
ncbi:MAG: NAD(P)H-binding protein [Acidimicrobiales bacterium]|nr:NAD(P)H-binding protein [Acidimicrobiales bacterium]